MPEPVGFGLFIPENRAGWTEDLLFDGPDVEHILDSEQSSWQIRGNYSITDRWNEGYVYVPRTPQCRCKPFRSNHVDRNPSHALVQLEGQKPMLVQLRPLSFGGEVTFNYFAGGQDDGGFGSDHHRTLMHWAAIAGRAQDAADKPDQCPELAIDLAAPTPSIESEEEEEEQSDSDFEFTQRSEESDMELAQKC